MKYKKWIVSGFILVIAACSGGGSGKSDGSDFGSSSSSSSTSSSSSSSSGFATGISLESNPIWEDLMQKDPLELSEEDLKIAYWGYALGQYQGKLAPADMTAQSLQKFYQLIEQSDYRTPAFTFDRALRDSGVKRYVSAEETGAMDRVTIDSEDVCLGNIGGFTIHGTFTAGVGSAAIDYSECLGFGDVTMTGRSVISGGPSEKPNYPEFNGTQFFESVNITRTSNQSILSGFSTWDADYIKIGESYEQSKVRNARATYDRLLPSNEEIIFRTEKVTDQLKNEETYEGSLALGESGSSGFVWLHLTNTGDYLAPISQLIFSGADGTTGTIHFFSHPYIRVSLDTNSDGAADVGHFYLSRYEFLMADFVSSPLVPVQEINYPPVIRDGELSWYSPPISSSGARVYDPECLDADTPSDLLEKKYIWKVDGVLIPEVTGTSLPAQYLEHASQVEVALTVSDGEISVSTPVLQDTVLRLSDVTDLARQHLAE